MYMMVLWKPLSTCGWIFGLVYVRLDCWISRNTLPWHISVQLVTAQQNEMLFWLAGMNYVKIRTHCRAQNLMTQHGETWNCVFEAELKMDTSQTVGCWIFDNVDNINFTFFDRIAKHGIICITDTFLGIQYLEKFCLKYHRLNLWSLLTPPGPADSLWLKAETARVFMVSFRYKCAMFNISVKVCRNVKKSNFKPDEEKPDTYQFWGTPATRSFVNLLAAKWHIK